MAKITPQGQAKNPITVQTYQGLALQGVANEIVPLGSSMGWNNFADANWVGFLTAKGTISASIATMNKALAVIAVHGTTCFQVATTNAITVNVLGIGRV